MKSASPRVSVLFPSHNGERTLPLTLEAFSKLELPEGGVEFIAIDNASTDRTRAILDSYVGILPLSVFSEPRPGKSFALNLGIKKAQGIFIIFTDDDVIPCTDWLLQYLAAAEAHPDASVFAGQVRHHWERTPPRWLARLAAEGRSFAGTPSDQGDGPGSLALAKGLNLMVHARVCEKITFCESPGVNWTGEQNSQGGEDTDFVRQCLDAGYELWFASKAINHHIVRKEQIGLVPVVRRYFRIGGSIALSGKASRKKNVPTILGYPRYLFRQTSVDLIHVMLEWFRGRQYNAANRLIDMAITWGSVHQMKYIDEGKRK